MNPHSSQTDPQLFQIQLSQLQTCQDEVDILAFSCGNFKLGSPHYNPELPVRPLIFSVHFTLWACTIKIITAVIYWFHNKARVFVSGKPFQSSLMFAGKAGAYPSEATSGAPI